MNVGQGRAKRWGNVEKRNNNTKIHTELKTKNTTGNKGMRDGRTKKEESKFRCNAEK